MTEFKKIVALNIVSGYKVFIKFDDDTSGLYDFSKLIHAKKYYEVLEDYDFFSKIQNDGYGVVWNDELDVASEYIYDNLKIA